MMNSEHVNAVMAYYDLLLREFVCEEYIHGNEDHIVTYMMSEYSVGCVFGVYS